MVVPSIVEEKNEDGEAGFILAGGRGGEWVGVGECFAAAARGAGNYCGLEEVSLEVQADGRKAIAQDAQLIANNAASSQP